MNRLALVILLVAGTLCAGNGWGQSDSLFWRTYGGAGEEISSKMIETSSGDYIIAGMTGSFNVGEEIDGWIIAIDSNGDSLWSSVIDFGGFDKITDISESARGGYLFCGIQDERIIGRVPSSFAGKIDSVGEIDWLIEIADSSMAKSILETSDGSVFIGGSISKANTNYWDYFLASVTQDGEVNWLKNYGDESGELCNQITVNSNDEILLLGSKATIDHYNDIRIMIVSADGDSINSFNYQTHSFDSWNHLIRNQENEYLIGWSDDGDLGLLLVDEDGDSLSSRNYENQQSQHFMNITESSNGGYYLLGRLDVGEFNENIFLLKTDEFLDSLWSRSFPGPHPKLANSVIERDDHRVAISGFTGASDFLFILTGTNPLRLNHQFDEVPPRQFVTAYPNPFNSSTTISYSLPTPGNVSLTIFDMQGRELQRIAGGYKSAGDYATVWEAGGLPSGVYFSRLQVGDRVQTVPLLLEK